MVDASDVSMVSSNAAAIDPIFFIRYPFCRLMDNWVRARDLLVVNFVVVLNIDQILCLRWSDEEPPNELIVFTESDGWVL